ncbi:MAG: hypothetical protein AABZ12_02230 [Planctomycetota bacterium]
MPNPSSAVATLEREFLDIRCRILDLAAALDRVQRGQGFAAVTSDPRWRTIHAALTIASDGHPDRADRVQMTFSDPYSPDWRRQDIP